MSTPKKPISPFSPSSGDDSDAMLGRMMIHLVQETKERQPQTKIVRSNWLDKHFGIPRNPEDLLWRFAWLFTVPALCGVIALPLMRWCWLNGYPIIPILIGVGIMAAHSMFAVVVQYARCQTPIPLIQAQATIPALALLFTLIWSLISHG
jgi:hypothetical protein